MIKDMKEYIQYSINRNTFFYSKVNNNINFRKSIEVPSFDKQKWFVTSDEHWTNLIFKDKELPDQGWKIHITADITEAQDLLYDVANYLLGNEISFKYAPNASILER